MGVKRYVVIDSYARTEISNRGSLQKGKVIRTLRDVGGMETAVKKCRGCRSKSAAHHFPW